MGPPHGERPRSWLLALGLGLGRRGCGRGAAHGRAGGAAVHLLAALVVMLFGVMLHLVMMLHLMMMLHLVMGLGRRGRRPAHALAARGAGALRQRGGGD